MATTSSRAGPSSSIEMTEVPSWRDTAGRVLVPHRAAAAQQLLHRQHLAAPTLGPGTRMPRSCRRSRWAKSRDWMNVVPDFIAPTCRTRRPPGMRAILGAQRSL